MLRTAAPPAARSIRLLLAASVLVLALPLVSVADARSLHRGGADPTIAVVDLPDPGPQTYRLILKGGPFPYAKDGSVFGNRERLLPRERRGFYREYTVQTPRVPGRGARRIVCGGAQPSVPEACYYTSDHYSSFSRIVP